jgi:hypothetical protein
VQLQLGDALRDRNPRTGQKTGAHAIGNRAEAQIETGWLNLIRCKRSAGTNGALLRERRNYAVGQNSAVRSCEGQSHLQAI